jgi:glycosyltransferase involved in cell wall biosynthesis
MRIGIDARFYGSLGKGLGRYTEKLLEHLQSLDQEHQYVVFLRPENFAEFVPVNPRFTKVAVDISWYGLAEQTVFVALLYRHHLDLVHFPHFNVPLLYRKKFVVTIHDLILVHYPTLRNTTRTAFLYWLKFFVYRLVIASAIRRAEHILTVSYFTKHDLEKHYPHAKDKITVTYEAADPYCLIIPPDTERALLERLGLLPSSPAQEKLRRDIIQPYFLYVGNAYPHKNLSLLFACARAFPESKLVLVGKEDFFYAKLKQEAKEKAGKNVIFAGFLTDRELATLYRFARAYLFPSLYEGFGLPPLEAMAHGTPVLSSDRGSLPEILGQAALFFDPTRESSLVTALQNLESDSHLWHSMQKRGYEQVIKFRFQDMAALTHQVYTAVLKNTIRSHGTAPSITTSSSDHTL